MKKLIKKIAIFKLVLATVLLCSLWVTATDGTQTPESNIITGTMSEEISWTFDKSVGLLTIEGDGSMVSATNRNCFNSIKDEIKYVIIYKGIDVICDCAFRDSPNLRYIRIPESVTEIGSRAFQNCTSLTYIKLPDSLKILGREAFNNCKSLIEVDLGNGSYELTNAQFTGCVKLKEFTITKNITNVDATAFLGCESLKNIFCDRDNPYLYSDYGVLYNKDMTKLIAYPTAQPQADNEFVIPKSVKTVGWYAFYRTEKIQTLYITSGLETIENDGFSEAVIDTVFYTGTREDWAKIKMPNTGKPKTPKYYGGDIAIEGHSHVLKEAKLEKSATFDNAGYYIQDCYWCIDEKFSTVIPKIASVTLEKSAYNYSSKAISPDVIAVDEEGKALTKGTDFTVKYSSGRKNPGSYTVKVTFKGAYSGKAELKFDILPRAVSGISATQTETSVSLKWNKVQEATGYRVYEYNPSTKKYVKIASTASTSYTVKNLSSGTTCKFKIRSYTKLSNGTVLWGEYSDIFETATKPTVVSIKSVSSSSKGKVTVKWYYVEGETSYQLYYSTSKNGTYKKMKSTTANTCTKTGMNSGDTLYFKVRAYTKVDGKVIYGDFGSVKSVKVK